MSMAAHDPNYPGQYYATAPLQSSPLIGAEGGFSPGAVPTGVLRKQGLSYLCCSILVSCIAAGISYCSATECRSWILWLYVIAWLDGIQSA